MNDSAPLRQSTPDSPPPPKRRGLTRRQLMGLGVALGLGYGLCARLVFGLDAAGDVFEVMSSAFIFGVPFALGFITVWCGEYRRDYSWGQRILMPWTASLCCLLACLALAWEGIICIFLWLPLVLILSSLGGLFAGLLRVFFPPLGQGSSRHFCVAIVALAPFLLAPLENLRVAASEVREVQTAIDIRADRETVWRQIRSVPLITESEHRFELIHLLGFPRPLEARLEGEGVGAIRYATFERGVLFLEQVTEWEPGRRLAFTIHADPANIPPTAFDEHVTIGGPYFDVLDGVYEIEDRGDGLLRLHLSSRQRLSTGFNSYSHLWTEFLMARLQTYILEVIKARCERP